MFECLSHPRIFSVSECGHEVEAYEDVIEVMPRIPERPPPREILAFVEEPFLEEEFRALLDGPFDVGRLAIHGDHRERAHRFPRIDRALRPAETVPTSVLALRIDEPVDCRLAALIPEVAEANQRPDHVTRRAQVTLFHEAVQMAKVHAAVLRSLPTGPWGVPAIFRPMQVEPQLDRVRDPFVATGKAQVGEHLQLPNCCGEFRNVACLLPSPVGLGFLPSKDLFRPRAFRDLRPESRQGSLSRPRTHEVAG